MMNDTTIPPAPAKNKSWPLIALVLFLVGFLLPILCWTFWLPKAVLFAACGAELLAFILGLVTWRRRLARIAVIGSMIFFLLGISLGRHGLPTYQQPIHPTSRWMKPLNSNWVLQSPGKTYSIQPVSDLKKNGDDSLRFELRAGEVWVDQTFLSTFRAEVATKEFPPVNAVRWYAFSVYFPTDFPIESNRLVFAQWKEKEGFAQRGQSPSLAFRFVNGQFAIRLLHSADRVLRDPEAVPTEKLFKSNNFALGRWHDFVVQAKWSYQDDGLINVWWNREPIVHYQGPVGYHADLGPQFKFGLYRDATDNPYVAWFNQVKSGPTPQEIDFAIPSPTR